MLVREKLTIRQFAILTFTLIIGDMILIYPTLITGEGKQDAWICSLLSQPIGLFIIWLIYKLHRTYPSLSLIEICSKVLGRWLGGILAAAFLFYFVMVATICIREVGDFMTTQIYIKTPIRAIVILFVTALTWGMLKGLSTMGKSAEIILPFIVIGVVTLVILLLPQAEISQLQPVLNTPFFSLVNGSVLGATFSYGELIILSMILPYTTHGAHLRRDMMFSALLGGAMLTSVVLIGLLVLGPELTQHNIYISFILSQKINIANFLQRIEALTAIAWLMSTYFKSLLYVFGFVVGLAQLFRLKDYKPLILPSMLLFFGMTLVIAPNVLFYTNTTIPSWYGMDITVSVIFPILLLFIHKIKNIITKRHTSHNSPKN